MVVICLPATVADSGDAGPHGLAVDQHGAGAAAALAAAVLAAGQVQVVAQDAEQASFRVRFEALFEPVDMQFGSHQVLPLSITHGVRVLNRSFREVTQSEEKSTTPGRTVPPTARESVCVVTIINPRAVE